MSARLPWVTGNPTLFIFPRNLRERRSDQIDLKPWFKGNDRLLVATGESDGTPNPTTLAVLVKCVHLPHLDVKDLLNSRFNFDPVRIGSDLENVTVVFLSLKSALLGDHRLTDDGVWIFHH